MPHAGLMSQEQLDSPEGLLVRARLHIRGARRRLRQAKIAAGIVTLADALSAAMEWYVSAPERRTGLTILPGDNLQEDRGLYPVLVRSRVLDGTFDFEAFDRLTEEALDREMPGFDYQKLEADLERVMAQLGVMPFDEALLPPEDPRTY